MAHRPGGVKRRQVVGKLFFKVICKTFKMNENRENE